MAAISLLAICNAVKHIGPVAQRLFSAALGKRGFFFSMDQHVFLGWLGGLFQIDLVTIFRYFKYDI